jgi:chromatin remodeling complex protein RSC6
MIKSVFKYIAYTILLIYALVAFLPKENLYYFALENLQSQNIVIKNETISSGNFDFAISDANIVFKSIDAVGIDKIDIQTLLLKSSIDIKNIKVDKSLKQFLPSQIDMVSVQHSIVDPLMVHISLSAKEIKGIGTFNIMERKLEINLSPSKKFVREYRTLLRQAKKQSSGEYKIEYQL